MAKILPQGTQLYCLAPNADASGFDLLKIPCVVSIDVGEDSRDEHEDTCLEETESHTFLPGLNTPGTTIFSVRIDPASTAHVRLNQLNDTQTRFQWAMGWSDGVDVDPADNVGTPGTFTLPAERTWCTWVGHVAGFNFSGFEVAGDPIQGSVSIKRSSKVNWVVKSAAQGGG